jgi:hypothetical protein
MSFLRQTQFSTLPSGQTENRNGLAAWWTFDGGSVLDCSGNQNAATFTGSPTPGAGPFGKPALIINGSSAYPALTSSAPNFAKVNAGSNGNPTGTWSVWFKYSSASASYTALISCSSSTSSKFGVVLAANNAGVGFNIRGFPSTVAAGPSIVSGTPQDGNWHHAVVVWNYPANYANTYFDGVAGTPSTFSTTFNMNVGSSVYLGHSDDSVSWLPMVSGGMVADARFYTRTLSGGEILALYLGAKAFPPAGAEPDLPALFLAPGVSSGSLAASEGADTSAFAGSVISSGIIAATEAADAAAIAGGVSSSGSLAAAGATDSAAITGTTVSNTAGALAATEAADTATISGAVESSGLISVSEAQDTAALSGDVASSGVLSSAEDRDTASLTGDVASSGVIAALEAPDLAAFAGRVSQPQSRLVTIPGVWSRSVSTKGQVNSPSVIVKGAYSKTITSPGLFGIRKAS